MGNSNKPLLLLVNVGGIFKVSGKHFYVTMKQFLWTASLWETEFFLVTFLHLSYR